MCLFRFLLLSCLVYAVTLSQQYQSSQVVFISNLSEVCMRCLCHAASSCNRTLGCDRTNYCGPFFLSREYWKDAGRPVLPEDTPDRLEAFVECANDYSCAEKIVKNYIMKFGQDCNSDGVTNCDDYAMLHFNLQTDCTASLDTTNFGRRYSTCRPPPSTHSTSTSGRSGFGRGAG